MQPPRWPAPPAPWARPRAQARSTFAPRLPPPPRGFPATPYFYPQPPWPPRGYFPRFVPPQPPPPPPRPPVADAEQLWLDNFKREHCSSTASTKAVVDEGAEPPLRGLRRRVLQAQKLVDQLKVAAQELVAIDKRLEELSTSDTRRQFDDVAASSVEVPRLRVQRERKLAVCEALKKELEEMNVMSGMLPERKLKLIRTFAARVTKKKAYRKRVKLRRRAEASISRAMDPSHKPESAALATNSKLEVQVGAETFDTEQRSAEKAPPSLQPAKKQAATNLSGKTLDPETLTFDSLVAVRRAWDSYIVLPRTPGASTIPPHFIPPPPTPSAQWAVYAVGFN